MLVYLYSTDFSIVATADVIADHPPLFLVVPYTAGAGLSFFRYIGLSSGTVRYVEIDEPDLQVLALQEWPLRSGDTFEVILPESN